MDPVTIQLAQLVAYLMLTLSSVLVASVSLMFGYRQNIGWKPIALVPSHGLSAGLVEDYYGAQFGLELWNRRKYPIVIRAIEVKNEVLEFQERLKGWTYDEDWIVQKKNLYLRKEDSMDPAGKASYSFHVPFKKRTLDDLVDTFTFRIYYFDPRLAKTKTITFKYKYHLGALDKK